MNKLVPESLNEVNFERGSNPMDAMNIGDRLNRLKSQGENLPIVEYLFDLDMEDYDLDDPDDVEALKELDDAKKSLLENGSDYAAILDYAVEEESILPNSWGVLDPHGTMGDVIYEWPGSSKGDFKEWALAVLEHFEDGWDIDITKYEKLMDEV